MVLQPLSHKKSVCKNKLKKEAGKTGYIVKSLKKNVATINWLEKKSGCWKVAELKCHSPPPTPTPMHHKRKYITLIYLTLFLMVPLHFLAAPFSKNLIKTKNMISTFSLPMLAVRGGLFVTI